MYKTTDSLQKKNDVEKLRRAEEIAQAFDSQFETPKTNSSSTFFGRLVGFNKDKDAEADSSPVMDPSTNNGQGNVIATQFVVMTHLAESLYSRIYSFDKSTQI